MTDSGWLIKRLILLAFLSGVGLVGRAVGGPSEGTSTNTPANPEPIKLKSVTVTAPAPSPGLRLDAPASTGTRLDVPVRELPGSITVVDRHTIDQMGARTAQEAAVMAPGMTGAEPPSGPGIYSSRGFTGNDILPLVDGISIGAPTMVGRTEDVWKYDRVEVLKGPASLLYGEGATAGAVNYVTKTPNISEFEHEVFTSYGSFNNSRLGLGSGGPISTNELGYRLDFSQQSSDGFVDRTGGQYYDLSGALKYDVSEQFMVTLSFDAMKDDLSSYWGTPLINGAIDPRTREVNYNVKDNINTQDSLWLRIKAEWRPSEVVTVRNTLYGYLAAREWQNVERYTYVPATGLIRRSSSTAIAHDQDIVGDRMDASFKHDLFGRENQFLAGLEAYENDFQRDSNRPDNGFDFVDPYNPVPLSFDNVRTVGLSPERRTGTLTGALFLEDQYKLFPRFSVLGGLRGELIQIDSENLRGGGSDFSRQYTPLNGRIGGVFEIVPNLDWYAQYATAAKPTSSSLVYDETAKDYRLERSEMVETGFKNAFWGKRAEWTLAFYQIWKKNIVTSNPANPTTNLQIGEQSSHGVEFGLALNPVNEWRVGGNIAALDATYDVFNVKSGATTLSYAGNRPSNVPEIVANVWTTYRFPCNVELGSSLRYVDQVQANNANTLKLPSYATLDLFATYYYKRAEFTVRVRNALDEQYALWSVGDGVQALLGEPLSVEGSVRLRF